MIRLSASKPSSTDPSKTRKTRSDPQFCDNGGRCQQCYRYRTKGKYERKTKRDAQRRKTKPKRRGHAIHDAIVVLSL